MAKLYAELSSDKGGRVASKGGDSEICYCLKQGNNVVAHIDYTIENGLHINLEKGFADTPININGYIVQ
jgi:hypothetical protein